MLDIRSKIKDFWLYAQENKIELYNEFSLQYELGVFLRNKLNGYKIQFERNINFFGIKKDDFVKKEIDIVVYNELEKCAIELKFPRNGQYPEEMYSFVKDIKFIEQLKKSGFSQAISVILTCDKCFWSGEKIDGIYGYFRSGKKLNGKIYKPTGKNKNDDYIDIEGHYIVHWSNTSFFDGKNINDNKESVGKYYIVVADFL